MTDCDHYKFKTPIDSDLARYVEVFCQEIERIKTQIKHVSNLLASVPTLKLPPSWNVV